MFRRLSIWLLLLVFTVVGIGHLVAPEQFTRFLPEQMPMKWELVIVTGLMEIVLGVMLLFPKTVKPAAWAIFTLLLVYTPLHVVDVLRDVPVIGPKWVAIVRLPVQLVFIAMAWAATKGNPDGKPSQSR